MRSRMTKFMHVLTSRPRVRAVSGSPMPVNAENCTDAVGSRQDYTDFLRHVQGNHIHPLHQCLALTSSIGGRDRHSMTSQEV